MGIPASGKAAGTRRPAAAPQALQAVLQPASRQGLQGPGRRLPPAPGHRGRRLRHPLHPRAHRRHLLRQARRQQGPRRFRPRRARLGHQGILPPGNRAHRPQGLPGRAPAPQDPHLHRQGQRAHQHGVLARSGHRPWPSSIRTSSCPTCTWTTPPCSWSRTPSSST